MAAGAFGHGDPERRARRKAAHKEAKAKGVQHLPRRARPSAQLDHGSNPRGRRKAREGERHMAAEAHDPCRLMETRACPLGERCLGPCARFETES